jgi:small ligand-binding sensory domain FIST
MIAAGVLERATQADSPLFVVKGGVALELRLRDRARATKDIDIVLRDTTADLADSLEVALTGEPYRGSRFAERGSHSCSTTVR